MNKKNLLIIFTRNPELGKCKTRLASSIGDQAALHIYEFLLNHTVSITKDLPTTKQVHYSVKIRQDDIWDNEIYSKKLQRGEDLGLRMKYAFEQGFNEGYEKIIIIGSDMYDLSQKDIELAFEKLDQTDFVLGPAEDGGYYLMGMKKMNELVFLNKNWGTSTVLKDTLANLSDENITLLKEKNDIDYFEDIKNIKKLQQFIPNHIVKNI